MEAPAGLEQWYELVELQVAARPAVQEQQGHCILIVGGLVHKVQVDAVDGGRVLLHAVELSLPLAPVIGCDPVLDEVLQPAAGSNDAT